MADSLGDVNAFALGLLLAYAGPAWAEGREVAILEPTSVHSGPGLDYFVIQEAKRGEVFDLVEERTGWIKVRLADDSLGWVEVDTVEISDVAGEEEIVRDGDGRSDAVVATEYATLYAGPGDAYVVVKRVPRGERMQILGRDATGEWLKVRLDGPPSWVRQASVDLATSIDDVATVRSGGDRDDEGFSDGFSTLAPNATPDLPAGLRARAGVGWSLLSHKLKTDAGDSYGYGVQAFAFDGEITWWGTPELGVRGRVVADWSPKRIKADRQVFEIDDPDAEAAEPLALNSSAIGVDVLAVGRLQVLKVGAWVEGRLGVRRWSFDVDLIKTEDPAEGLVEHPAFYPIAFVGPVLGGGFHMPLTDWLAVYGALELVPVAVVSDAFDDSALDTRSGDVDGAYGAFAEGGLRLTPFDSSDYSLDVDVRVRWQRFFTTFVSPEASPAERTTHRFLEDYRSAESEEGSFGAVVAVVLRL